jgi:hypothetical protein
MQGGKLVVRVGYDLDMKINTFVVTPAMRVLPCEV